MVKKDNNPNRTYVDSSSDQGSRHPDELLQPVSPDQKEEESLGVETRTVFQKGIDGQRTVPMSGGLAFADTPECTVYINKKQWVDDTWTYGTNTSFEREGKSKEVLVRQRLANIITRKIDWMTEHELFTKVKSAIDASIAFDKELTASISQSDLNNILKDEAIAEGNAQTEVNFPPTSLGGSSITRYYTESVLPLEGHDKAKFISVNTTHQNRSISYLLVRPEPSGAGSVRNRTIVAFNRGSEIFCDPSSKHNVVTHFRKGQYVKSTEAGEGNFFKIFLFAKENSNLPIKRFIEPPTYVSLSSNTREELDKKGYKSTTYKGQKVYIGYISRYHPVGNADRPIVRVEEAFTVDPPDVSYSNMFNGVIELANIGSVNTNISLTGEGNATITMENPQNIFQISEDDIDIVLGESPFLEISESGELTEKEKTGHYYYRGRYYTKRAYGIVTGQRDSVDNIKKPSADQTKLSMTTASDILKINNQIANVEKEALALTPLSANEAVRVKMKQLKKLREELIEKRNNLITSVENPPSEPTNKNLPELPSTFKKVKALTPELRLQRDVLKKYFQGKHIFEPFDRIFIWFSSPSTTAHRSPTGEIQYEVADPDNITQLETKIDNNNEVINEGLVETQRQCFQGVIKSISSNWNDGKYTMTLSCVDNTHFLTMSRYMNKPALSVTGGTNYISAVDDPIYRLPPKASLSPKTPEDVGGHSLVGKWKQGLYVVSGQLHSEEDQANIEKNQARTSGTKTGKNDASVKGEDLKIHQAQVGQPPSILTNIFGKLDSANIISMLVTAIPFNPALYFQQALSVNGGVQVIDAPPNKENGQPKAGEKVITGPTEEIRKSLSAQNERLGNFVPTTEITRDKVTTAELIIGIANQALSVSDNIRYFFNVYMQGVRKASKKNPIASDFSRLQKTLKTTNSKGEYIVDKETGIGYKSTDIVVDKFEKLFTDRSNSRGNENANLSVNVKDFPDSIITPSELKKSPASSGFSAGLRLSDSIGRQIGSFFRTMVEAAMNQFPYADFNAVVGEDDKTGIYLIQAGNESMAYQEIVNSAKALLDAIILAKSFISKAGIGTELVEDGVPKIIKDFERKKSRSQLVSSRERIITKTKNNYFAVEDEYSFNTNIQAYQAQIGNNLNDAGLWKSEYEVPLDRCRNIAGQIDFEFFADENGNLRFKPPTYNRTLPEHLLDIESVESTHRGAMDRLVGGRDVLELLVKMKMRVISKTEKQSQEDRVKELEKKVKRLKIKNIPGGEIQMNSKYKNISKRGNGGYLDGENDVNSLLAVITVLQGLYSDLNTGIEKIIENNVAAPHLIDTKEEKEDAIAYELANRKRAIGIIDKHITDLDIIIPQIQSSAEKTSTGALSRLTDPEKIHRISDSIIISSNFTETAPDFTRLDVEGKMDFIESMPALYLNAAGVDYDLWRSYGFKQHNITAAFLHSGNQCVPYCQALLARQWAKVHTGSVTVRGDSKYKLADTVYVEYLNMYFYVSGVGQSFSYGGQYNTTLTLTYGRRVGFYIPYPFDVLGNVQIEEALTSLSGQDYRKSGGGWETALDRPIIFSKATGKSLVGRSKGQVVTPKDAGARTK